MKKNKQTISAQSFIPAKVLPPPSPNQSFAQFITYVSEPKFDPKDYVQAGASKRDILLYKEIFEFLDQKNNNVLQPMDLRRAFETIGNYNPKKSLIYKILADFDSDQSGIIEFKEFVKMMTMKPCDEDSEEDLQKVFYMIDQDYKGYITKEDLQELAYECKDNLTVEQIEQIIALVDPAGKGVIRYEAFIKEMRKKKFDGSG